VFPGLATDYAAMAKAALALHAATLDRAYVADAERFAAILHAHHWDGANPGYFLSADDAEALILRPRSNVDEATPSANALMGANLVRLWRLTGNDDYRRSVDAMLAASAGAVAANLLSAAGTLNVLDLRLGAADIVLVSPPDADTTAMLAEIRRHWSPNVVLSLHRDTTSLPVGHPASGKPAVDGKVTVYVCRGETCSLPVTEPHQLSDSLAS
jgi:uncharacterized protein YyaL (SSP411 family)